MAEFLIIDARQNPDGTVELRRTYSTPEPHHRQREMPGDASPVTAVVVGPDGEELATSQLRRFEPPDAREGLPRYKIRGAVPLPRDAVAVRLIDDGRDIAEIPLDPSPELDVVIRSQRNGALVQIEYSEAGRGAWMAISVYSDVQAPRTVYLGKPVSEYELDTSGVYGPEARVGVLYSTGTRSNGAVSEPFKLGRKPAPLAIAEPPDGATFTPWDVIDARAGIVRGAIGAKDVLDGTRWTLNKEILPDTGRLIPVGPLGVGRYELSAKVDDSEHMTGASATVTIIVADPTDQAKQAAAR